jgi:hypothetical protein
VYPDAAFALYEAAGGDSNKYRLMVGQLERGARRRALNSANPLRTVALIVWGRSKREPSAMTCKIITVEFVLPTAIAIALGILLSIGAVYLAEHYLGSVVDLLI